MDTAINVVSSILTILIFIGIIFIISSKQRTTKTIDYIEKRISKDTEPTVHKDEDPYDWASDRDSGLTKESVRSTPASNARRTSADSVYNAVMTQKAKLGSTKAE